MPVDKNGEGIRNPVDHLTCYAIQSHTLVNRQVEIQNQFGSQTLVVRTGDTLCVPSVKIELEIDRFPDAHATITLHLPNGDQEQVDLSGTMTIEVHIGPAGSTTDTDGDGLDQVTAEIVQMKLKGKSAALGTFTLEVSGVASLGEIEETANTQPGQLDIPPFAPAGTAQSFFDVFFVLNGGIGQLHNSNPTHMVATITHKPPAPGETFTSGDVVDLLDANNHPTGVKLGPLTITPVP